MPETSLSALHVFTISFSKQLYEADNLVAFISQVKKWRSYMTYPRPQNLSEAEPELKAGQPSCSPHYY